MLSYLRQLFGSDHDQAIDQLAREIAERSLFEARQRLGADVSAMSAAELRGYVRARAMRPVREQSRHVIAGHGRHVVATETLVARALERTVHLVTRQLALQSVAAPQTVPLARRRAG